MKLTPLKLEHAQALESFVQDFRESGEEKIPAFFQKPAWNHEETVDHFAAWARGEPMGWTPETVSRFVPCTTRFLEDESSAELLGLFNFRHRLNEQLERFGGHVGYSVRPSARGRGHAGALLRHAMQFAVERGLAEIVVTCSPKNVASSRTILSCGGELMDSYFLESEGTDVLRYTITLSSGRR